MSLYLLEDYDGRDAEEEEDEMTVPRIQMLQEDVRDGVQQERKGDVVMEKLTTPQNFPQESLHRLLPSASGQQRRDEDRSGRGMATLGVSLSAVQRARDWLGCGLPPLGSVSV